MMPTQLPDYTPFAPSALLALDPGSAEAEELTEKLKKMILSRLNTLPGYQGAEEAVIALRSLGYPLSENVAQSEGYSFQARLKGGSREFDIVGLSDWVSVSYYVIETADEKLAKMSESERADYLIRSEFRRLAENLWNRSFGSLGTDDAQLIAIDTFERELNNGGFLQYFGNTMGEQLECLVASLTRIGAEDTAKLLERAIGIISVSTSANPKDWSETLQGLTEAQEEQLNELDFEFYELTEDLELLAMKQNAERKPEA